MDIYKLLKLDQTELTELANEIEQHYRSYPIKKASGKLRWIDAPDPRLKFAQKAILFNILYKFKPHESAVGFVRGVGVKDGAERHLGNKVVLCMDVHDFFGSLKLDKVYKAVYYLLGKMRDDDATFEWTAQDCNTLVKILTYKGSVPQGAPTSPALANLICRTLDDELKAMADKYNLTYTRYADDLTFSHRRKNFRITKIIKEVEQSLGFLGLELNKAKTRVLRPHRRMCITGVVVNEKLSVPKYVWRNLRAQLHNLTREGNPITTEEYQKIRGKIEWIGLFRPQQKEEFLASLGQLTVKD